MTGKRILIVTDAWHPQINGVVSCYEHMREELLLLGYEVEIIHPGLFKTLPLPGYSEIRLAIFPKGRLERLIGAYRPDFIHVAVEGPLGWAALSLCKRRGWSFTTCYHTNFARYIEARLGSTLLNPLAYGFLRRFHNAGARTMTATASLKGVLESNGFGNVALWPLGVDTKRFKRSVPPTTIEGPVFGYMGRLAAEKNVDEFLKAELPGTKLVIGDGPERKRLEKKFGARARFVGYKEGQELVSWLSLCDVLVFPSRTDTFGLVIIEALACGIPIAAHDVTGPRDIVENGVDGYLGEDLAEAARKCLTLDRSKCREKALRYSWRASAHAFANNLVRIVHKGSSGQAPRY